MLDDLLGAFTQGHRKQGHSPHWPSEHGYREGHHDKHRYADMVLGALRAIVQNKVLLAILLVSGLAVLALCVWVFMTLLSFSGPILDFISRNGIKGVVETAGGLAQKFWEGAGK